MRKILSMILVAFCAFACDAKALEDLKINEFFLDNGLQVIVIENHKAPIVKQMLFYKTGSADERKMKGGIAHLLEHMMFRGTSRVKGQKFNKILEENGVESNAFTSQDVTAYHQLADVSKLELIMYLEADRMKNLALKNDDFLTEREIVFQERKQRVDNNPAAKFFEKLNSLLWQEHPYANPVTGLDYEIKALNKKDALDFYEMYYAPNNAVLVLAGDVDVATARMLADKYYGKIGASKFKETVMNEIERPYKAHIEMSFPEARLGRVVKKMIAPSINYNSDKFYALTVLEEYLSGDENSPFYQKLVVWDKNALSVDVSYDGIKRSYGSLDVRVVPTNVKDEQIALKIDKAWKYAIDVLDEEKLDKVKQKVLSDLAYVVDNPDNLSLVVGYMAAVGMKIDDVKNYSNNIKNVRLDDVKEIAADLWNNAPQVSGVLYPEGEK